ncbi:uncharacterized protein LOC134828695 [Culicoides brevitarsis]|uniref:uncharacterized protein LOC134828695 n=1 Tax=Culicoides brevitarsis TaxID=469753 RepID=UPI00307BBD68
MVEKSEISKHYEQIVQHIISFQQPGLESLQSYYGQMSCKLNSEAKSGSNAACPGCCLLRTDENQIVTEESPVLKKQRKRLKAIQKLRKIKQRTKKQENMLKKLLMRKNGAQIITCKLCNYTTKKAIPQSNPTENADTPKPSSKKPQNPQGQKRKAEQKTPQEILTKKQKKKTAGLNPLYVKPKASSQFESASKSLNSAKNLQKLSQMLQESDKQKNSASRLDLFLK